MGNKGFVVSIVLLVFFIGSCRQIVHGAEYKVLAVMSYEESYPWVDEIRQGIESLLVDTCRIKYFYLNTKTDFEHGHEKAKEAYTLYKEFKPDGVIVADDDGQAFFVVPYLKDKVKTPVIFCGVNADAQAYGYPASNVTGVLEREPMKESLTFLQQLVPHAKTLAFLSNDSPTATQVEQQLEQEKDTYPLRFVRCRRAQDLDDAVVIAQELKLQCDALLYITMEGLRDTDRNPLTDSDIMPLIVKNFGKPVITNAPYRVRYGALAAVVKSGQGHGRLSAEMLMKAMQGTPVSQIPITRNRFGRRIINVDAMKNLGIKPKPALIRTAELVWTD